MATIFTQIINRQIPSHLIWEDDICVAFLDIAPHTLGHCLVVPRLEESHFTQLPSELAAHLFVVAQRIGATQERVFKAERAGLAIVGFDVPHVHLHVFPMYKAGDFDAANRIPTPSATEMATAAAQLRAGLSDDGWADYVVNA